MRKIRGVVTIIIGPTSSMESELLLSQWNVLVYTPTTATGQYSDGRQQNLSASIDLLAYFHLRST